MIDLYDRDEAGNEVPRVFGHLTMIRPTGELIRGVKVYECRCDCGNLDKATIPLLMMGRKTSCGCRNRTRTEALKPEHHEVERLRVLVLEDGRNLAEIAAEAGLAESVVAEGLAAKKRLSLATTCSLLKALGRHWADLDEPVEAAVASPQPSPVAEESPASLRFDPAAPRSPLPRPEWAILPNGARPRHLAAILTRNRLEPPQWFQADGTWMAPFAEGDGLAFGEKPV